MSLPKACQAQRSQHTSPPPVLTWCALVPTCKVGLLYLSLRLMLHTSMLSLDQQSHLLIFICLLVCFSIFETIEVLLKIFLSVLHNAKI